MLRRLSPRHGDRVDDREIVLEEVRPAVLSTEEISDVPEEGGGRRRVLSSANRYPFLSLLFSGSATRPGDYVLADEAEAVEADNPLVSVFLWDDPALSLCWFSTLQVVFYLLAFCDFSLFTIGAVMAVWQLVVDFVLFKTAPSLKQMGFLPYDFDARTLIKTHTFFSTRLIKQFGAAAHESSDVILSNWVHICVDGTWPQVLVAVRVIFMVFIRSFSVAVTTWIILICLFTLPFSYSSRSLFADATREFLRWRGALRFLTIRDMAWQTSEYLGKCADHYDRLYKVTGSPMHLFKLRYFVFWDRVISAIGGYAQRFAARMEGTAGW